MEFTIFFPEDSLLEILTLEKLFSCLFSSYQADYYAHPENYRAVFHEKIAPFTSVIGQFSLLFMHIVILLFILVPLCWECGSCFISIYSATDNMIFFSVNSQTITFGKTYKLLPAELEIFLVIIYKKRLTPPLNSIRIHLSSPVSMTGSCFFSHSLHLIPG